MVPVQKNISGKRINSVSRKLGSFLLFSRRRPLTDPAVTRKKLRNCGSALPSTSVLFCHNPGLLDRFRFGTGLRRDLGKKLLQTAEEIPRPLPVIKQGFVGSKTRQSDHDQTNPKLLCNMHSTNGHTRLISTLRLPASGGSVEQALQWSDDSMRQDLGTGYQA